MIKDLRFRDEGFGSSSITGTGTIVNNSSGQISLAQVYTALYDKDNKPISVESGSVDVSTLAVGDNSAFNHFRSRRVDRPLCCYARWNM